MKHSESMLKHHNKYFYNVVKQLQVLGRPGNIHTIAHKVLKYGFEAAHNLLLNKPESESNNLEIRN